MIAINLIPGRLRDAAAVRARVRRWIGVIAGLAAALAAACAGLRLWGGEGPGRMDGDGGQLAARLASGEQTLDRLRKEVQEHARRLEASETVGVHPDWSTFLAALASVRGEGVVLQVVEVRATDADKPVAPEPRGAPSQDAKGGAQPRPHRLETYLVTLKGYGLSQSDVMGFVRRLEELGPLVDVRLNQTRAQPFQSVPAVGFDAECRLVERPPPHLTRAGAEPEAAP